MTTMTPSEIESLTLSVILETQVKAPIDVAFEALLEQLGPSNETPDGRQLQMKLEPWPGGRWFRDLGGDNGHLWAHVQAIKRPTLLEFCGPLMMSHPVTNNVQYRLSEENGVTVIKFRHTGFGLVQEDHKKGVGSGWSYMLDQAKKRAERRSAK